MPSLEIEEKFLSVTIDFSVFFDLIVPIFPIRLLLYLRLTATGIDETDRNLCFLKKNLTADPISLSCVVLSEVFCIDL